MFLRDIVTLEPGRPDAGKSPTTVGWGAWRVRLNVAFPIGVVTSAPYTHEPWGQPEERSGVVKSSLVISPATAILVTVHARSALFDRTRRPTVTELVSTHWVIEGASRQTRRLLREALRLAPDVAPWLGKIVINAGAGRASNSNGMLTELRPAVMVSELGPGELIAGVTISSWVASLDHTSSVTFSGAVVPKRTMALSEAAVIP